MNILFLSAWYPHRYDEMFGLFVQKHAQAVSKYCSVTVLYLHADKNSDRIYIEQKISGNLNEVIVYYPEKKFFLSKKIFHFVSFLKGYKTIIKSGFTPDIIHAHILKGTGLFTFLLSKLLNIPYVISEHWSIYLPAKKAYDSLLQKKTEQYIFKHAFATIAVSKVLKDGMIDNGLNNTNFLIVNNVVDNVFHIHNEDDSRHSKVRFLHISCFDEKAKNITGILKAARELFKTRNDFELVIIGDGFDFKIVTDYAKALNFDDHQVSFLGTKSIEEVAHWYKKCDVVVLFSNYETANIVIAESLVSGRPVISTNVGIAPEYIDESNGIIVETGNTDALMKAMNKMIDDISFYNKGEISSKFSNTFSFDNIGKQLYDIYLSAVTTKTK